MKKLKMIFPVVVLMLAAWMFVKTDSLVYAESNEERISEGIYVETVDIGGMTAEEAKAALEDYIAQLEETEFTLAVGEKTISVQALEMGLTVTGQDVVEEAMSIGKTGNLLKRYKDLSDLEHGGLVLELNMTVDEEIVTTLLNENLDKIETEAVDHGLIRENGKFTYIPGATGIVVNVEPSVSLITQYIAKEWNGEDAVIELSAEIDEPKGSEEELKQIQDVLGTYNTNFKTSSAARIKNIQVATERINGTLLYPGEEFSVNEAILYRNAANGYEKAGSYEGGQTVQSYGGGVCQVSTTLYNAVILAELEVTERKNHSMTVSYVPLSMDAAIAGDYLDLKFKNNQDYPIYLEGYTKGKDLYFTIYGVETRPANRTIEFESVVVSTNNPPTQFTASESPVGTVSRIQSKHVGYTAQLWKIVKENGVEVSREQFNKSTYKASPMILSVGIASDNEMVRANVYNAVATGDAATIYNALYGVSPEAAAAVLQ